MKLQSLGYKTDLIFATFDGEVIYKDNYTVVKTLSNPNYFWGNFLIFKNPPTRGDYNHWINHFNNELTDSKIYHRTFGWDKSKPGDPSEFIENGYRFEKSVVLTASSVNIPPKYNAKVQLKLITTEDKWNEVIVIQVLSSGKTLSKEEWLRFSKSQALRYKSMISAGMGHWFGVFIDGKLLGSLGLFKDGVVGRYQVVCTHPDFQRQGICSTLVYLSAKYAFEFMNIKTLVMIADQEYHAAKIYESVGFKATEEMYGLCWWDKNHT